MGTKALAVVTIILGLGFWLAWTNPTAKAYEHFQDQLLSRAVDRLESSGGGKKEGVLRQLAKTRSGMFFKSLVRSQTVRRNYGLFCLFETKLLGTKIVVLGVGGKFIPLTDVDDALREVEQSVLAPKR